MAENQENQELEEDLIVDMEAEVLQEPEVDPVDGEVILPAFPPIPSRDSTDSRMTWADYQQRVSPEEYLQRVMPTQGEKIIIDYDNMLKVRKADGTLISNSDIVQYLIEDPINFGDRFGPGAYKAFRDQGHSDDRLLAAFSNVRSVGKVNAYIEEWARGVGTMTPGVFGLVAGASVAGPPGMVVGGITGFVLGHILMGQVIPGSGQPRVTSERPAAQVGMIVGGSSPFRKFPSSMLDEGYSWLTGSYISPMNRLNLGADFLESRMNNWFSRPVRRLQDWSSTAVQQAQRYPGSFAAAEIGQTWSAAGAGYVAEAYLPRDMPIRGFTQFGIELGAAILDPRSLAIRKIPVVQQFSSYLGNLLTFNIIHRTIRAGGRVNDLLLDYATSYDKIYVTQLNELNAKYPQKTIEGKQVRQNLEQYNEELAVIQEQYVQNGIDAITNKGDSGSKAFNLMLQRAELAGEEIPNAERTAAIVSGIPFFYALESRVAPFVSGKAPTLPRGVSETQEYLDNALRLARIRMAKTMQSLVDEGSPEALSTLALLRREYSELEIQKLMQEALEAYQTNVNRALAAGETMDTGAYLHRLFFDRDSNSVLRAIEDQSKLLKDAIPPMEGVNLNPLIDAYNEINDLYRIALQTPTISDGSDLVSIDNALKQYAEILSRGDVPQVPAELTAAAILDLKQKKLNLGKAEEALEAEKAKGRYPGESRAIFDRSEYTTRETVEQLELNLNKIKNDIFEIEHPVAVFPKTFDDKDVTANSRQIVTFISVIDGRMQNAMRKGDKNMIDILQRLREGAMNSLGASSVEAAQVYYEFDRASRAVFGNNFLGRLGSNVAPELIGSAFFEGVGDVVYARIVQMNSVLKFLEDSMIKPPDINLEQMTEKTAAALSARRSAQESELGTVDLSISGTVRQLQEVLLNGMLDNPAYFKKVQQVDTSGNLMFDDAGKPLWMREAQPALGTWMQEHDETLEVFFPEAKQILDDTQQTAAYFNMQRAKIDQRRADANDAFQQTFEGRWSNPASGIQRLIGTPESRALNPSLPDPVNELKEVIQVAKSAKVIVNGESVDVGKELYRVLMDHALAASKAGQVSSPGNESLFNANLFRSYWKDPLGAGQPSLERLLRDGGIITDDLVMAQRRFWDLWDELNQVDRATAANKRRMELGPDFLAVPTEENLASQIERLLVAVGGSVIGSSIRDIFSYLPLLRGGAGGLIAASEGRNFLVNRLLNAPEIVKGDLFLAMMRDTELMAVMMQEALNAEGVPIKRTGKAIQALYTWLGGVGLMPATVSVDEFASMWEREPVHVVHPERRAGYGAEAAIRRSEVRQRDLRNRLDAGQAPEEVVVEETEEVDFSPAVGYTPPPLPPLTMPQGPPSTDQGPPSTDQDAYAAAFPYDSVSEVIRGRQGLGGLA